MSDANVETVTARLSPTQFFKNLPTTALLAIAHAAQRRHAARESAFFQQGDPATTFYILDVGQVRITQLTPEGNQVILRFIRVGELFGGIAALGVETYPASAHAVQDSQALSWDTETMRALILRFPQLGLNVLEHAAQTIVQMQDRVRELQTERVERRVARALLRLARQAGVRVEQGVLIDLPLSRQDLAEMTGTNLYSVSRILSAWEKQALVQTGRERVVVRQPHQLVMIAEDLPAPPNAQETS